jgi:hypothetical protein
MNKMTEKLKRLWLVALAFAVTGCANLHKEATSISDAGSGNVIVVGRVELVPRLKQGEQKIRLGTVDPFNAKGVYIDRAMFHLAAQPTEREKTTDIFNPHLEETFFYQIPKDKRYVVDASVVMSAQTRLVSARRVTEERTELLMPAPLELDIRPGDTAIYIGTIRVYRDEFNSVTKFEILDQSSQAAVDFKNKFGSNAVFRKALVKVMRPLPLPLSQR